METLWYIIEATIGGFIKQYILDRFSIWGIIGLVTAFLALIGVVILVLTL